MQKLLLALLSLLFTTQLLANNEIKLSLAAADQLFLAQNLKLLAERYNIEVAEAMLIQAGLFENPRLSFEQIAYNRDSKQYFNTHSQHALEIEQVLPLWGTRSKQKEIERYHIEMARQEFESVLRELKCLLHTHLIDAAYTQKSISIFDKEIEHLTRLIKVYQAQYEKGNVSLMERSRLEAFLFTLKTDQLAYINSLHEIQNQIRLLLNIKPEIRLVAELGPFEILPEQVNSTKWREFVEENPQIKIAQLQTQQEKANLALQKRMRLPDIAVKGVFDKASNISSNYMGVGVSIALPLFNRNQGTIKAANAQLAQSKVRYDYQVKETQAEIASKLSSLKLLYDFYNSIDKSLEKEFSRLIEGVSASFEKRNINMLEFIDYYETYKETCLKLYENESTLLMGVEEINKLIGSDYIKLW